MDINDLSTWDVLAVDDEFSTLDVIQYVFSFNNVALRLADSGPKALEMIQQRRPSLVLLDIKMPEMSGWEVIQKIRANPLTKEIPVVAVTAHAMVGDEQKILAAGFNGYIAKPISPLEFINSLQMALAKPM